MMDFTEVEEGKIETGSRVSVHFRIRQFDSQYAGLESIFGKLLLKTEC